MGGMLTDLKKKTVSGLLWSGFESLAVSAVNFIITIILARILLPEDFGIVAVVVAFIALGNTIVDCGLSNALIRKKDCSEKDFSTVTLFNVGVAIVLYIILWALAPAISMSYYGNELVTIIRIMGIVLIFNSLSLVPQTKLTILIDFKGLTLTSFVAALLSGLVGIIMALNGCGLWSIVWQQIILSFSRMVLLWLKIGKINLRQFSADSFKNQFRFGSKLLIASMLDSIYSNVYSIVIGKQYGAKDLGYYSKSNNLAGFMPKTCSNIVQRVAYPIISRLYNDGGDIQTGFIKLLGVAIYVIFPIMIWLIVMAEDLVILLLTDKWLSIVPIFQILCFALMLYPIHTLNLMLMQVKGRSDIFLRVEIIKKIVGFTILFVSLPMGVMAVYIGQLLTSIIALIININFEKKIIGVGFMAQFRLLLPILLNSILTALICYVPVCYMESEVLSIVSGAIVGVVVYFCLNYLLRIKLHKDIVDVFNELKNR